MLAATTHSATIAEEPLHSSGTRVPVTGIDKAGQSKPGIAVILSATQSLSNFSIQS